MVRFLLNIGVSLAAAALAFLFCAWLIADFSISVGGFFIAVAIFTALQAVLAPITRKLAAKYASAALGGIGIISTLLSLWLTTLISGALSISGVAAWVLSALVIWVVSGLVTWVLGYIVLTRWWDAKQDQPSS